MLLGWRSWAALTELRKHFGSGSAGFGLLLVWPEVGAAHLLLSCSPQHFGLPLPTLVWGFLKVWLNQMLKGKAMEYVF